MFWLARALGKITVWFLRLSKRGGGTALPGLVALRIDPRFLQKTKKHISKGVILITGTNGKTTTSKLIADTLVESGHTVLSNPSGSNLERGIVAALLERLPLFGSAKFDYGLFEVDEAAFAKVAQSLNPSHVVVLNLFRDQLDRYGELNYIAGLIKQGLTRLPETKVILNADDPLVATLAETSKQVEYFGLSDVSVSKSGPDIAADSIHCPICSQTLLYDAFYYGHLGNYHCGSGHFARPALTTEAKDLRLEGLAGQSLSLTHVGETLNLKVVLPGLYNTYNLTSAFALISTLGIESKHFLSACQKFEAAFGRMEKISYQNRYLYLLLVKNPTGFNQTLETFVADDVPKHVLILINDNYADGRDISWLWDVEFELLIGQIASLTLSGKRALDMAVRLKYAGLDMSEVAVISEPQKALEEALSTVPEQGTLYVMPTYTAMFELRTQLSATLKNKEFWEA